jgi:metallo-beta-lactamase class B
MSSGRRYNPPPVRCSGTRSGGQWSADIETKTGGIMKSTKRIFVLAAAGATAMMLYGAFAGAVSAADQASEPLSKTYRITRAKDVEFQKVDSAKVFDNLYYVGPGYVSVWLLTTPQGDILFDTSQEPYVDWVIGNIKKYVNPHDIKYIILSHGHLDHFGGAAKIQAATGARVIALDEDWKMIADVGSHPGRDGGPAPAVPKRDMVVKEGDTLDLGGQHLIFHHTPGHTPGVLTTEGIVVYDNGAPHKAILWGGGGYRGGLHEAEESVTTANQIAAIKGVEVNLQIHSWAEPVGYPGGGVNERILMLKNRKPGDPHPMVDPVTWNNWVKRAQEQAVKAVEKEKEKAAQKG